MINRNYSQLTLDEVVFEQRNQAYGAFELRQIYNYHLLKSVFIMFFGVSMLAVVPIVLNYINTGKIEPISIIENKDNDVPYIFTPIEIIPEIIPKTEKPAAISKPIVSTNLAYKPVENVPEKPVEAIENAGVKTDIVDANLTKSDLNSIINGGLENAPIETNVLEVDVPINFASSMPVFKGLNLYLSKNLIFPSEMAAKGVSGKLVVSFIVGKNGKIRDLKIARSSGYEAFDNEALRVVAQMPDWQPGLQNNKAVSVLQLLPINFKLLEDK
ncbi:MAG: energy transducer TonB [Bacteroidetes bacterium]|nr:MAG: energy transducer TonB [Bacteroidota bacterium]